MNFTDTWKDISSLWAKSRLPKKGIALALGGGAALGAAHIGVLKALDEYGVKINRIAGTSIGALIATLHAFGKTPDEMQEIVNELEWLDVTSFTLSKFGLLSNDELGKQVNQILGDGSFSDAKIPLYLVATDLAKGKKIVLDKGDIAKAVMASSCIPGIFVPVEIDDMLLVDGGLIENVPVTTLRKISDDFIVGVDLTAGRQYQRPQDIIDVVVNAIDISIDNVTRAQSSEADLIIAPELSSYSRRDTSRINELIDAGYESACKLLDKLKS